MRTFSKTKMIAVGMTSLALAPQTLARRKVALAHLQKDAQAVSAKKVNKNKNELKLVISAGMLKKPDIEGRFSLDGKFTYNLFSNVDLVMSTQGNLPGALWNTFKKGSIKEWKVATGEEVGDVVADVVLADDEEVGYVLKGVKKAAVGLLYKKEGSSLEGGLEAGWISNILGFGGIGGKLNFGLSGVKVGVGMQKTLRIRDQENTILALSESKHKLDRRSMVLASSYLEGPIFNLSFGYHDIVSLDFMLVPNEVNEDKPTIEVPDGWFIDTFYKRVPAAKLKLKGLPIGISEIALSYNAGFSSGKVFGYDHNDGKGLVFLKKFFVLNDYYKKTTIKKASYAINLKVDTASSLLPFLAKKVNIKTLDVGFKKVYQRTMGGEMLEDDSKISFSSSYEISIKATIKKIAGMKIKGGFALDSSGKGFSNIFKPSLEGSYEIDFLAPLSAGKKVADDTTTLEEFENDMDEDGMDLNLKVA